jgi:tellurite resistance-related uncharacterized protein
VERTIVGFTQDEAGDWVAHLACHHRQHVRHAPPFRDRPWVLDDEARAAHVGTALDCPLCDRAELPEGLVSVRVTDTWTEETLPRAVRRDHRVAAGLWGLLHVESGSVRFRMATTPPIDRVVTDDVQPIPPDVRHSVEPIGGGPLRCAVEFLGPPAPEGSVGG